MEKGQKSVIFVDFVNFCKICRKMLKIPQNGVFLGGAWKNFPASVNAASIWNMRLNGPFQPRRVF